MSQKNVEIVRRIDAFDQRDLDAALRDVDPDIELDGRGRPALRQAFTTVTKPQETSGAPSLRCLIKSARLRTSSSSPVSIS